MTVTVQYSRSLEWQSGLISEICHSPFSHVDVITPEGNCLGASDSPQAPFLEGNPNGVAVRPPDYQPFAIRRQLVLEFPPEVEARFWAAIRSQLGKPFDGVGMHAFIHPNEKRPKRDWREADAWFCSELFVWSVEQGGAFVVPRLYSKDSVTPGDSLFIVNDFAVNAPAFDLPVPGLVLGPHEE